MNSDENIGLIYLFVSSITIEQWREGVIGDKGGGMRIMKHPALHEISIEQVFYALSDPVRLEIVQKLCMTDEATCSALDGGRPKSSVSHHFRVLREAGLVWTRNEGVSHMNALRRAEVNERFPGLLDVVEAAKHG